MEKIIPPFKEEEKQKREPDYTEDEIKYRDFIIERIEDARDAREEKHIELDDMTYTEYYESNYKTGNAYIREKKNKEDSRIVTGTTLEKENTFLSAILNYNFEPNVDVFDDKDMPLFGLGDKIESLVKKSRLIEDYDSKRALFYKEGADQGTWYVEDTWVEEWKIAKKISGFDYNKVDVKKIKWDTKKEKNIVGCVSNLLPGTAVYLGNMWEFFETKQPYIVTRDIISYAEAKACYGEYDRFEYVSDTLDADGIQSWRLDDDDRKSGDVEILKYQDKWANEYMLMLNGVMMLPVGFPLTAISPSGEYTIVKGDIEPISKFFAISKSYPAKTKVDQEILDDTLRTMVLRMRQMLEPPLANNTGTVLSRRIFWPGAITPDINPAQLQPIIPNMALSGGEYQVYSLIKQIVDEKTSNPVLGGGNSGGKQTATQIMTEKQQSMMKLGYAIFGILNFENKLTWLRIYNLLSHWTMPIDSRVDEVRKKLIEVYKTVVVDSEDEYGKFTRVMDFNEEGLTKTPEQLDAEAKILSTTKKKVQKVYLNPKLIRDNFLKWLFVVSSVPQEKQTTELKAVLFDEKVMKAKQMYGPQATNDEYCKQRSAILSGEDPDQFWAKPQPQAIPGGIPGQPGVELPPGQQPVTQDLLKTIPQGNQSPSLNTIQGKT